MASYRWAEEHLAEGEEMSIEGLPHVSKGHPYLHTDAALVAKVNGKVVVVEEVHGIPVDPGAEQEGHGQNGG